MSQTFQKIQKTTSFLPPSNWQRIQTIDMHTGGEPLRVIVSGFPAIEGDTVLDCRNYVKMHYDDLRKALMHEPRGHADMYGCLLVPPNDEGADFGILFLHNEGYSTMCGHAVIAITKLAVEMGWVDPRGTEVQLKIDAPCGRITSFAKLDEAGRVSSVYFHGVPSFVVAMDQLVEVEGLGQVRYDLAYGGAFYAYVDARQLGLALTPDYYSELIKVGMQIKRSVWNVSDQIVHPFEKDLSFLYGTIFIGEPVSEGIDSRNVCVFADGEVDRCPTGSGVSGRMPLHFAKGEINAGDIMRIESITGSVFEGSIVEQVTYGPYQAVIPRVEGTAYITGQHEFLIDPDDPFAKGFFLR